MSSIINNMEELLGRVDRLSLELSRLIRATKSIQEGSKFNEAFDEELYYEWDPCIKEDTASLLSRMIQHILEFYYGELEYKVKRRYQIEVQRNDIIDTTQWFMKSQHIDIINYMKRHLTDDIYEEAIGMYKLNAKTYKDLIPGLMYIPDKCPWETLDELIENSIDELVSKLPI